MCFASTRTANTTQKDSASSATTGRAIRSLRNYALTRTTASTRADSASRAMSSVTNELFFLNITVIQFPRTSTRRKQSWTFCPACPAQWSNHSGPPNFQARASVRATLASRPFLEVELTSLQALSPLISTAGFPRSENQTRNRSSSHFSSVCPFYQLTTVILSWKLHDSQINLVPVTAIGLKPLLLIAGLSDLLSTAMLFQAYILHWSWCRRSS